MYFKNSDQNVKYRVEREVGGGIGMGNTCKPMAVSFQCMTKFTTKKKKVKKKKKKTKCQMYIGKDLIQNCSFMKFVTKRKLEPKVAC